MLRIVVLASTILVSACTPLSSHLKANNDLNEITPSEAKSLDHYKSEGKAHINAGYIKANRPIFALIDGYYQLPNASAYGAAKLPDFSYSGYLKNQKLNKKERTLSLNKLPSEEQAAMHEVMDTLLDLGVKLYEIPLKEVATMSEAESQALKGKGEWNWASHLMPKKIDYFMSIYKTTSKQGPVLVGRVLNLQGKLLAFRVMNFDNTKKINNLVLALFEDALAQLENNFQASK